MPRNIDLFAGNFKITHDPNSRLHVNPQQLADDIPEFADWCSELESKLSKSPFLTNIFSASNLVDGVDSHGHLDTSVKYTFLDRLTVGIQNVVEALWNVLTCGNDTHITHHSILDTINAILAPVLSNPFVQGLVDFAEYLGETTQHIVLTILNGITGFIDTICAILTCNNVNRGGTTPFTIIEGINNVIQPILANPFVQGLIQWAHNIGVATDNFFMSLFHAALALGQAICSLFTTGHLPSNWGEWSGDIADILATAEAVFEAIFGNTFIGALHHLVDDAVGLVHGTVAGAVHLIQFLVSLLGLDDLSPAGVITWLQDTVDCIWRVVHGAVDGVGKTIRSVVDGAVTLVHNFLAAFGENTFIVDVVNFFHSFFDMLGVDDRSPQNMIEFFQVRIDRLTSVFQKVGSVGNTVHDLLESIIDWFENLPFIKNIVSALIPGIHADALSHNNGLGAVATWTQQLLNTSSWLPADNLTGQVPHATIPVLPLSHLGDSPLNLLSQGGFTVADTISAGDGWSFDAGNNHNGTGGCVKVVADGSVKRLYSNRIKVSQGQKMDASVAIKWSGLSPTVGGHVAIQVELFEGTTSLGYDTVVSQIDPGSSHDWEVIENNSYAIPNGVDNVRMVLWTDAAAGTIWWDDAFFAKSGLGAPIDAIVNIFHQGEDASPFVPGTVLDNLWLAVFGHQKTQTGSSANNLDLVNLMSTVSGGAVAVEDFERTSSTDLGATWKQTYTSSHGHLATPDGHDAEWVLDPLGGTNRCVARFYGNSFGTAYSQGDYQRVSMVTGSEPRRGANGTAHNSLYARMNTSGTEAQNYVRADWGGDGVVTIYMCLSGVETQLTNLAGVATSANVPIPNAGTTLTFDAGDFRAANWNKFTAYQDGQPVLTAYDLTNTNTYGPSYRGWGFGSEVQPGWPLGQVRPAKIYYWTGCDQGGGSALAGSLVTAGVNAGNLTAGTLDVANRVSASAVTNSKLASDIDGSKVTSGLVDGSRVNTNLTAGHIGSGIFNIGRVPTSQLTRSNISDLGSVYSAITDAYGSGAKMSRHSTGNVSLTTNTGASYLPSGFFDTDVIHSSDITPNVGNAKFQVTIPGWYDVHVCLMTNISVSAIWNICPILLVNNTAVEYGNDGISRSVGGGNGITRYIQSSFGVALAANDYVGIGIDSANGSGTISNILTGGGDDAQCYFAISLSTKSI